MQANVSCIHINNRQPLINAKSRVNTCSSKQRIFYCCRQTNGSLRPDICFYLFCRIYSLIISMIRIQITIKGKQYLKPFSFESCCHHTG